MNNRSLASVKCGTALGLLMAPGAAFADISHADVWANLSSYVSTVGGVLTADTSSVGGTTSYDNITASFNLPLGSGTLSIKTGSLDMTETADGLVEIRYPETVEMQVDFVIHGETSGSLTGTGTSANQITIASGAAGDITYEYSADSYAFTIGDVQIERMPADLFDLTGQMTMNGVFAKATITQGNLIQITGESFYEDYVMEYSLVSPDMGDQSSVQTGKDVSAEYALMLPTGGMSVMNLAAALRDGLSITATTESGAMSARGNQQDPMIGTINTDFTASGSDMELRFDQDGLAIDATATGYDITAELPEMLPFPISAKIDGAEMGYEMPLSSQDAPGAYGMLISLAGLSVDESLWGMVDPTGQLPHDPADLTIDISGNVAVLQDLLDIEKMAMADAPPVELRDMTINSLLLSIAGAEFTGAGSFSFDNSDYATFDGIPAPTGALDLQLIGGNGLMDKLVAMGLLPQEQAMGARMMMGLFATPGEGEDSLTSKIEIDGATGAISANGQRLP